MLLVVVGSIASFVLARAVRADRNLFRSRRRLERSVGAGLLGRRQADPAAVIDAAGQAIPMHTDAEGPRLR
jgi:hypothetical protein